jgi:hypothetical protein
MSKDEVQRQRIIDVIQKWAPMVGLDDWHFKLDVSREPGPLGDNNFRRVLSIEPDWRYMDACIVAHLPQITDTSDADLEEYIVHELMHAHLDELDVADTDHEERVATTLARAFITTFKDGQKENE